MNDAFSPAAGRPAVHLGVRGLPDLADSMIGGGLYALIAETPPARFPLLAGSLRSALDHGMACSVVTPAAPEMFLERVEPLGGFNAASLIAANRLNVFQTQAEFQKKMFRFGAERFVRELERFEVPERSYMLFDQADELLALHDVSLALDQVEILRRWFEQRQMTGLLVFTRSAAANAATINALMDNLTGITHLGGDRNGLELTFDYWQSPEGAIAARTYHLRTLDSGYYEASALAAPAAMAVHGSGEALPEPAPEDGDEAPRFFYMDPDLGSLAQQMPGIWQRVDTLVGMLHATQGTRAATLILTFYRDTHIRQLAEAVHTLRLGLGRRARIVVQEKGASLRYQNEALLLRLGVNLVVHRDVAASRLPLLLESLNGQIFSRDVNINFEAALSSVLGTRSRGYLPPARFIREVEGILDRAETLSIPYALVIGRPAAGKTMGDIIATAQILRAGDLLCADLEYCYLFLNACPQPVLLATLPRILGMPLEEALQDVRFSVRREDIQPELAHLAHVAQGELPDYSHLSHLVAGPAPQGDAAPIPDATDAAADAPPVLDTYTRPSPAGLPPLRPVPRPAGATAASASVPVREVLRPAGDAARFSYDSAGKDIAFARKTYPRAVRSSTAAGILQEAQAAGPSKP